MDERRDDWRHGVDENLVTLNAAQRVTDSQLDDLELKFEDIDIILRGDPKDKDNDGLIAEVHALDTKVNDIRAELFRIKQSFSDEKHEIREDRRLSWGNLTKIVIAIITSGAIGLFWQDIKTYFEKHQDLDSIEQMLVRAKRPKPKPKHRRAPRPLPPPAPSPIEETPQ